MTPKASLYEVHSALSHLAFAVSETLRPINAGVSVKWNNYTYLSVEVECYERDRQLVVNRLKHGALTGPYDYRFSVSSPTGSDPTDWVTVSAYPDMSHDERLRKSALAS